MDWNKLPPEIIEAILLNLDVHDLATCTLADEQLEKLIYSRHFIDRYCKSIFGCSWITGKDVLDFDLAVSHEFWFWTYETVKASRLFARPIYLQSKILTKIGSLKHQFYMWVMFGYRSSYLDAFTLMHTLYRCPDSIYDIFVEKSHVPQSFVFDTLMKIYLWLPEIVHISCTKLKLFSIQKGHLTSQDMRHVYQTRLEKKLPSSICPLYSLEMICCANKNSQRVHTPALIVLFMEDYWVLWFGMPCLFQTTVEPGDYLYFGSFEYSVRQSSLREELSSALCLFSDLVQKQDYSGGYGATSSEYQFDAFKSPVMSLNESLLANATVAIAQEHFNALKVQFKAHFLKLIENFVDSIYKQADGDQNHDRLFKVLNAKASSHPLMDEYVEGLFNVELFAPNQTVHQKLKIAVCKCLLQQIAILFRNEISRSLSSNFSHIFLCGCAGKSFPITFKSSMKNKVYRCLSIKVRDGLYSPKMWPPHVLSAACLALPALINMIQTDISLLDMGREKNTLSTGAINQILGKLRLGGLTLMSRPPGKPRFPPIYLQLKLFTPEVPAL